MVTGGLPLCCSTNTHQSRRFLPRPLQTYNPDIMGEEHYEPGPTTDLDDIDGTLQEILSAINNKESGGSSSFSDVIWFLVFIFILSGWSGSQLDRFTDRLWYSVADDTDWKNVNVTKRPTNCDFLHAPLGSKSCSYKKRTDIFGDKERKALVESSLPEDKDNVWKKPNSVLVYWDKQEEP